MIDGKSLPTEENAAADDALTILLVEDNPDHAELVQRIMADSLPAAMIVHLEDGVAALSYLLGHGAYGDRIRHPLPHLMLLDLRLPRIDGLEVLRQVKENPRLQALPVVILTTSKDESDVTRACAYQADGYLTKSGDYCEFSRRLRESGSYWLARRPW